MRDACLQEDRVRRGFETLRAHSYASIECRAAKWRTILAPGIAVHDAFPAADVFVAARRVPVDVGDDGYSLRTLVVEWLPRDQEGITWLEPERKLVKVGISESTAVGLVGGAPRAIFCFAHELGHGILHRQDMLARADAADYLDDGRGTFGHPFSRDSEWQANAFAAALLMPAKGIPEGADAAAVADMFGVSMEAAEIRLRRLARRKAA